MQFGLFGSVLENLAPPVNDVPVKVGVASLACLVLLLLVGALADQLKSTKRRNLAFGIAAVLAFVAAGAVFLWYENLQAQLIYRYPVDENPAVPTKRYIRGELHEEGRKRVGSQTIAGAVWELGGPSNVVEQQLLWSYASQKQAELQLTSTYLVFVFLLGAAIYCLTLPFLPVPKRRKK